MKTRHRQSVESRPCVHTHCRLLQTWMVCRIAWLSDSLALQTEGRDRKRFGGTAEVVFNRTFLCGLEERLALARASVVERKDALGKGFGFRLQQLCGHHPGDESCGKCRIGRERVAEEDHRENLGSA